MPAQLVALTDGPDILVDKPILLLGRHPECDIQIESRKISRRHCCIAQVNDYLVVRDLDSTNGIRINGVRVVEGRLEPGDELTVGNHRYQVRWDDPPAGAARAARPALAGPPARPRPPVAKGLPLRAEDEDELLESCEEPVPLPDPDAPESPRVQARPPPVPPPPRSVSRPPADPPTAAQARAGQADGDSSIILPENLELMPGSGPFPRPGLPGPPPAS